MTEDFIDVEVPFSDDELRGLSEELTEEVLKIHELEAEKRALNKSYSDDIKTHQGRAIELASEYDRGYRIESIRCALVLDHDEQMRFWKSVETGATIRTEPFRDEDYQHDLNFPTPDPADVEKAKEEVEAKDVEPPEEKPDVEVGEEGLAIESWDEPPPFPLRDGHQRVLVMVKNMAEPEISFRRNTKSMRAAAEELLRFGYIEGHDHEHVTGLTEKGWDLFDSGRVIPF